MPFRNHPALSLFWRGTVTQSWHFSINSEWLLQPLSMLVSVHILTLTESYLLLISPSNIMLTILLFTSAFLKVVLEMNIYKSMIDIMANDTTNYKKKILPWFSFLSAILMKIRISSYTYHTPIFSCVKTFGISTSYTLTSHFTYI